MGAIQEQMSIGEKDMLKDVIPTVKQMSKLDRAILEFQKDIRDYKSFLYLRRMQNVTMYDLETYA